MGNGYEEQRKLMVDEQLAARGIADERVVRAMGIVPRELFVPAEDRHLAYADRPVPIGHGQTISQPFVVAHMLAMLALEGHETVLEVGTGSGYTAAVLARLARRVISVERVPELAEAARARLAALDVSNVDVICGDGSRGWPACGPYDGVVVHAMVPAEPEVFLADVTRGGHLVVPVASGNGGVLTLFSVGRDGAVQREALGDVSFVPLVSDHATGHKAGPSQR